LWEGVIDFFGERIRRLFSVCLRYEGRLHVKLTYPPGACAACLMVNVSVW